MSVLSGEGGVSVAEEVWGVRTHPALRAPLRGGDRVAGYGVFGSGLNLGSLSLRRQIKTGAEDLRSRLEDQVEPRRREGRQEAGYGNPAYGERGGKWAGTPIPAMQGWSGTGSGGILTNSAPAVDAVAPAFAGQRAEGSAAWLCRRACIGSDRMTGKMPVPHCNVVAPASRRHAK